MSLIGYTTGVFDLFHLGHLNILKRAKLECDFLVVGVTTDELAMEKKGKRPVIPFEERIAIVGAIKFVDEVVPQVDMDKYAAWRRLKFDRIFVGDDWKGSEVWSSLERRFGDVGVDTVYFPYTQHTSSSTIRKLIENLNSELC